MLAFEPLYRFEPVADVVIGQVGRLEIGHRTGCVQADVVPVNICLQCIVDEHILFVEFVGELAVQRVFMFRAVAVFSDYAIAFV